MPDHRKHRGPHPQDEKLFHSNQLDALTSAVHDLSWLLSHGYSEKSSLKLVGDRYRLTTRQRMAVVRSSCSEQAKVNRQNKLVPAEELSGKTLWIDGFNLLISIESALSGGILFEGLDSCYRDLASIHGTYKWVMETDRAIQLIGDSLDQLDITQVLWLLDKPVSNSGRLKTRLLEIASINQWKWTVDLVFNPDYVLIQSDQIVVSSDSMILNETAKWFNLVRWIVYQFIQEARVISFER